MGVSKKLRYWRLKMSEIDLSGFSGSEKYTNGVFD